MKTFKELDCWKLARQLGTEVSKLVKSFPEKEKKRLIVKCCIVQNPLPSTLQRDPVNFILKTT